MYIILFKSLHFLYIISTLLIDLAFRLQFLNLKCSDLKLKILNLNNSDFKFHFSFIKIDQRL